MKTPEKVQTEINDELKGYYEKYNVLSVFVVTKEEYPELKAVSYKMAGEIRDAIEKAIHEYIEKNKDNAGEVSFDREAPQ